MILAHTVSSEQHTAKFMQQKQSHDQTKQTEVATRNATHDEKKSVKSRRRLTSCMTLGKGFSSDYGNGKESTPVRIDDLSLVSI